MDNVKTLRQQAGLASSSAIAPARTALLLIDFQMEYYSGGLPLPDGAAAAKCAADLVGWADRAGVQVVHIHHVASHPLSPLFTPGGKFVAPHPLLVPAEHHQCLTKGLPSSFVATGLHALLCQSATDTLVIAGLMTHMCVDSTARDALSLGYKSIVAADACATRDLPDYAGSGVLPHRDLHRHSLSALADRYAEVMDTHAIVRLA